MEPSKYQKALLDWATDPDGGNGVVEAVAGSGKTTSLAMVAQVVNQRMTALSFAKAAAEQLGKKMPNNVDSTTISSVGHRAWSAYCGGRVDLRGGQYDARKREKSPEKNKQIIAILQERGKVPKWLPPGLLDKVVKLAKCDGIVPDGTPNMTGLVPDTLPQWTSMMDHHGVPTDERITPAILTDAAREVLRAGIIWAQPKHRVIDFDDQPYMSTLTDGVTFPQTPWVVCDELQDTSALQAAMIARLSTQGGRFLGVGDSKQAIYGFRGAGIYAMEEITRSTEATRLPLSICYRCPTSVLDLAREIVPQIEAAPGAIEGIVEHRDEWNREELLPDDLIICRNRAPMIQTAYRLLGAGAQVRVLGNNNGGGLIDLLISLARPEQNVDALIDASERRMRKRIAKAIKAEDEQAEDDARDEHATICAIVEGTNARTVGQLVRQVKDLFEGPREGRICVGTIHAVKGLEADRVWFLDPGLIPARGAKKDWQLQQERNLKYVALTRARKELRFVQSADLV